MNWYDKIRLRDASVWEYWETWGNEPSPAVCVMNEGKCGIWLYNIEFDEDVLNPMVRGLL